MTFRDPGQVLSAEARRGERRREMCVLADEARRAADLTTEALAADVGCTRTAIQKMLDADDLGHPVHADVLTSPLIAPHALRLLARRLGFVAIELPKSTVGHATLAALVDSQRETTEAVTVTLESLADGVITPAEAENAAKQIDEAIEALAKLKRAIVAAAESDNVRTLAVRK